MADAGLVDGAEIPRYVGLPPGDDIMVVDQSGDRIGEISEVYVDESTGSPFWIAVKIGAFGTRETFIPLGGADAGEDQDSLHVPFDTSTVVRAPAVDPDEERLTLPQELALFRYYGMTSTAAAAASSAVASIVLNGMDVSRFATAGLISALQSRFANLNLGPMIGHAGSIEALADRMIAAIPTAGPFDEEVGPFYDTAGLRKRFDLSRQAIDQRVKRGDLLCLKTSDNHRLYPSFQFDEHGDGIPRLREVLELLPEEKEYGPWQAAAWLNAAGDDLDGLTPAEVLRTGRSDDVIRLARQAGAPWRR
ncbi:PRC-barrel domain-containing protein [Tersicoccus sp. MR15.9]|uniref:PRC-barrel domain-containing protein n=1 Tax=Tersicoccus mangrovi TaxID=3121635 RepID=UPI002FE69A18